MPLISTSETNNCLFFFYFFIGCYVICVTLLIYTLIRLLKYYLTQRRMINQRLLTTTVLLKIQNLSEEEMETIKGEFDVYQPLIIKTHDLLPIYPIENQAPPAYREHL